MYHLCQHNGQQDTFRCGRHTVYNEDIGTCDYRGNVRCREGQGFDAAPSKSYNHKPGHKQKHKPRHKNKSKTKHHHHSHHQQKVSHEEPSQGFFSESNPQFIKPFTRVQNTHHKFMHASYMKHFAKFLAILHHNASFFNFCIIIL